MKKEGNTFSRPTFRPLGICILLFISIGVISLAQDIFCGTPSDIDLANQFFRNKEYDKAIEYYLKAPKSIIDSTSEVKYGIGLSHFMLGNYQEAVKYWTEAKKQNPKIFEGRIFRIPSVGMAPQLIVGDLIIIDTEYYRYRDILREDVIIFRLPNDKEAVHIKRIIGLPEEVINIRDGEVFVNDSRSPDRHASFLDSGSENSGSGKNWGPVRVPKDNYFVLGDNRNNSQDSRHYGFINKDLILGKALVIYGSTPEKDSLKGARPERMGKIVE